MCRYESESLVSRLIPLLESTRYPAAILDRQLSVLWASAPALEALPMLSQPQGVRLLLEAPETLLAQLAKTGVVRLSAQSAPLGRRQLQLCALPADCAGLYLLCPAAGAEEPAPSGQLAQALARFPAQSRAPLAMILSTVCTLSRALEPVLSGSPRSMAQEYFQVIGQNAMRILRSSEESAAYLELALGSRPPKRTPVELRDWLVRFLKAAGEVMSEAGVPLTWELPEAPMPVACDLDALSRALLNLLANAAQFTRPGNRAHVRAALIGEQLTLAISDKGLGIPPEVQAHVFEPMYSYDHGGSLLPGSGLGLAVVQLAARTLGGTAALVSEPGRGTCVTLTIPLKSAVVEAPPIESFLLDSYPFDRFSPLRVAFANCPLPFPV